MQRAPTPSPDRVPASTPLIWVGGGALLTLTTMLVGGIAFVRAFAVLFH